MPNDLKSLGIAGSGGQAAKRNGHSTAALPLSPRHVLLVDDDQEIVAGASIRLRAAGYYVASACDGEQGIAAAKSMRPDAIILDVKMPRMNGLAALARLKESETTSSIPVVILSASLAEQRAALAAGAQFYLRKPYKPQALLSALDAAIDTTTATVGANR
jgi:CheY-like chemotaxis protein